MPSDCQEKYNPHRVKRNGVHQDQRLVPALNPGSVLVDEHEPANWIVFARRYAQFIHFYDLQNQITGDWKTFFDKDPAAILAVAAIQNLDFYQSKLQEYFYYLNDFEKDVDLVGQALKVRFNYLFNCIGTLALQLDRLKEALPADTALKAILKNLIVTQLEPAFGKLIGYYNAAVANNLLHFQDDLDWEIMGSDIFLFDTVLQEQFSDDWLDGASDWTAYKQAHPADAAIFITAINPHKVFTEINHVATHSLFTELFSRFLKAYARSVEEAKKSLAVSLSERSTHDPHYTLFLTFLQLLVYARDHINTFTGRHLDYYHKEVLRLRENPAVPNQAHIIVELAKHADTHLLGKGTLLRGGKDSEGKDVFYSTDEDFVANKSRVTDFRSVYQHIESASGPAQLPVGKLYASPVSNSDDGAGAELTTPDGQWHPFANKKYAGGNLTGIGMPEAKVGFAIASEHLLLQQGARTVTITCVMVEDMPMDVPAACFSIEITGEKGWISLAPQTVTTDSADRTLSISFLIEGDQPAIVPYAPKIHGPGLAATQPVAKVWLKNLPEQDYWYGYLANLTVSAVAVFIHVENLKNLSLSNDSGVLDPGKPFQPFGAIPAKGGSFIVGCYELFRKKKRNVAEPAYILGNPQLRITWQNALNNTYYQTTTTNLKELRKGAWVDVNAAAGENIFQSVVNINANALQGTAITLPLQNEPYSADSKEGFIKFELRGDFGHSNYQIELAQTIIKKEPKPKPPYTPVILDISLTYDATVVFRPDHMVPTLDAEHQFLHLYPFGYEALGKEDTVSLLPRFQRKNEVIQSAEICEDANAGVQQDTSPAAYENEAEFYIGIEDLNPPQNVSILFQLAEGSANPRILKPENHVHWSYLSNNKWIPFTRDKVSDRTAHLLQSGIIMLSIPRNATNSNTILPEGKYWVRAGIDRQASTTTDAVSKIIAVRTQATTATFKDTGNAADFLQTQLPAATISKLLAPEADIKKIEQPYPTFGGRPQEAARHFSTRVSERLRHKDKAITVWDYERLILEEFPHIFKAKCLNHTRFEPTENGMGRYNEMAPGHVTVIAIPNLRNQNAIDPLHPSTSLGDLSKIALYLRKHVSCFVNLHVHNPEFEQIRIACCVKLQLGSDEGFYLKLLQQEILRFLSPWAFGEAKDINFGGTIYKSALINFVEERPYVDYVTDFQMFHTVNGTESKDLEEAEASTAISILVSAPAVQHQLRVIPATISVEAPEKCNC